jgi:hypothetical protein
MNRRSFLKFLGIATTVLPLFALWPKPVMAYSKKRKLLAPYSGACVRLRGSDNYEADISFDREGYFNEAAMQEFGRNHGTPRMVTWYDQSGNGNDLVGNLPFE